MSKFPSLSELYLLYCQLDSLNPFLGFVNFTSLQVLDLSINHFNHEIPNWFSNLTVNLLDLRLSENSLKAYKNHLRLPCFHINLEMISLGSLELIPFKEIHGKFAIPKSEAMSLGEFVHDPGSPRLCFPRVKDLLDFAGIKDVLNIASMKELLRDLLGFARIKGDLSLVGIKDLLNFAGIKDLLGFAFLESRIS
ncbi:hypothetical protein CFP56_022740 [Quercus suber]|uniref:Uncharacterized protein n=1 Tax=Quercus suber TaxID=58331 RepID=A0AAW0KCG1_QUESU